MAWEISITQEGWQELYEECHEQEHEWLVQAILGDEIEAREQEESMELGIEALEPWLSERQAELRSLPHDILADRAIELIEQNNTCDNGGWA